MLEFGHFSVSSKKNSSFSFTRISKGLFTHHSNFGHLFFLMTILLPNQIYKELQGRTDDPPILVRKDCSELTLFNTSPLEVGKLIRTLKKSHMSPCGIAGKFLQLISKEISYSLSQLFNNFVGSGWDFY